MHEFLLTSILFFLNSFCEITSTLLTPPDDQFTSAFGENIHFISSYWLAVSDHKWNNGQGCVHLYHSSQTNATFTFYKTISVDNTISFGYSLSSRYVSELSSYVLIISAPSGFNHTLFTDVKKTDFKTVAQTILSENDWSGNADVFVYLFDELSGNTGDEAHLRHHFTFVNKFFGTSVCLSPTGILAVGSPAEKSGDVYCGGVHMYNILADTTEITQSFLLHNQLKRFTKPEGADQPTPYEDCPYEDSMFGASVFINPQHVAIGGFGSCTIAMFVFNSIPLREGLLKVTEDGSRYRFPNDSLAINNGPIYITANLTEVDPPSADFLDECNFCTEQSITELGKDYKRVREEHIFGINERYGMLADSCFGVAVSGTMDGYDLFVSAPYYNTTGTVFVILGALKAPWDVLDDDYKDEDNPDGLSKHPRGYIYPTYVLSPETGCATDETSPSTEDTGDCLFGATLDYNTHAVCLNIGAPGASPLLVDGDSKVTPFFTTEHYLPPLPRKRRATAVSAASAHANEEDTLSSWELNEDAMNGVVYRYYFYSSEADDNPGRRDGKFSLGTTQVVGGAEGLGVNFINPASALFLLAVLQRNGSSGLASERSNAALPVVIVSKAQFFRKEDIPTLLVINILIIFVTVLTGLFFCVGVCILRHFIGSMLGLNQGLPPQQAQQPAQQNQNQNRNGNQNANADEQPRRR